MLLTHIGLIPKQVICLLCPIKQLAVLHANELVNYTIRHVSCHMSQEAMHGLSNFNRQYKYQSNYVNLKLYLCSTAIIISRCPIHLKMRSSAEAGNVSVTLQVILQADVTAVLSGDGVVTCDVIVVILVGEV